MIKRFLSLALIASVMFTLPSCDTKGENEGDKPLTEEESAKLLLAEIDAKFEAIVSNEWVFAGFEPSDAMLADKGNSDIAFASIAYPEGAKMFFSPITISFSVKDGVVTPSFELTYDDAELDNLRFKYEDHIYNGMLSEFGMTTPMNTKEADFAQIGGRVTSCFGSDELGVDDISDESTGELIFTFEQNDLSEMSYDDIILNQRVLVKGNNDKIYIEEDGSLVVETTSVEYGVSKYRYTLAE